MLDKLEYYTCEKHGTNKAWVQTCKSKKKDGTISERTYVRCVKCQSEKVVKSHKKNPSSIRKARAKWESVPANKEKTIIQQRKYYQSKIGRETRLQYYKNNREKILNQAKKWRDNNLEKIKARSKEYYENNRDTRIHASSTWYYNNREKMLEYQKKYREDNKEQLSSKAKERYARKTRLL
jgi:hypothetical protein